MKILLDYVSALSRFVRYSQLRKEIEFSIFFLLRISPTWASKAATDFFYNFYKNCVSALPRFVR